MKAMKSSISRYGVIAQKNPREIVLLRGTGCVWRKCRFCDYHLDACRDEAANYSLNCKVLEQVNGRFQKLEVINSGSFVDLDEKTMQRICEVCQDRQIREVHFESHWLHRAAIPALRQRFAAAGIEVKVKIGVETFDALFRECYLDKGIDEADPQKIAADFDEVCLLQGLPGQTAAGMCQDIAIGLKYFERVCVNIMTKNSSRICPDPAVIALFKTQVYPLYRDNQRVDILLENTAFGVGGKE